MCKHLRIQIITIYTSGDGLRTLTLNVNTFKNVIGTWMWAKVILMIVDWTCTWIQQLKIEEYDGLCMYGY